MRVLYLADNRKWPEGYTEESLYKRDLKAYPHSGTPPPTRPHILILPVQLNQLWTKHSNIIAYGDHSYSNIIHLFVKLLLIFSLFGAVVIGNIFLNSLLYCLLLFYI